MTDHIDKGGPAFPSVLYKQAPTENWSSDGMTLRDWFAGQALAGIYASEFFRDHVTTFQSGALSSDEELQNGAAMTAYAAADAMIAARKGGAA